MGTLKAVRVPASTLPKNPAFLILERRGNIPQNGRRGNILSSAKPLCWTDEEYFPRLEKGRIY